MARCAVRVEYQRRNEGRADYNSRVSRAGRSDNSARCYAGGGVAARCPYLGTVPQLLAR